MGATPTFKIKLKNKEEGGRMKTVIITEGMISYEQREYLLNLEAEPVKRCRGCWNCWIKTPGRCIYKDLDAFYKQYLQADCAIYYAKVEKGFVSSRMKALFERLSPLYLPYIAIGKESTMHVPRYPHYPDVIFYYEGEFETEGERSVFESYIERTFEQFYSKLIEIRPLLQNQIGNGAAHI